LACHLAVNQDQGNDIVYLKQIHSYLFIFNVTLNKLKAFQSETWWIQHVSD